MSRTLKQAIMWAVFLLLVIYMFHLNPTAIISDIVHAVQTVHNSR